MTSNVIEMGKKADPKPIAERSIYTQNIVDMLVTMEPGNQITYEELSEIVGMNCQPGGAGYQYVQSAINVVLSENYLIFENVRKVGYQLIDSDTAAKSELGIVTKQIKSRLRKAKKRQKASGSEWDGLSKEAQYKHIVANVYINAQLQQLKPKGLKRLEAAVRENGKIGFKQTMELFAK
jgi:hypothetical protein